MQGKLRIIYTNSQCAKILTYLEAGNSLTVMECLQKGWGANLRSRISNIKEAGHKIKSEKVRVDRTYIARYSLETIPH